MSDRALQLLITGLVGPSRLADLEAADWRELLQVARRAGVLPRLTLLVDGTGLGASVPARAREQLLAARPLAEQHERVLRWEVSRIGKALHALDVKTVLLKGAAYVMAGLPPGQGRLASDVDILVPRERLEEVERSLLDAGWTPMKLHPYDQRYYRRWSHELPPLEHRRRGTVVDVHHTILPVTGRLHPDPVKLIDAARPLSASGFWILAPEDLVVHATTHLFQDGELAGGMRDLVDVDSLLRHFGAVEPGFWDRLVPRAAELDLARPLFYGLRFCRRMLETPVPRHVVVASAAGAPPRPVRVLMDALAVRALTPDTDRDRATASRLARGWLYARYHWLRMPPWLLLRHLTSKVLRRWRHEDEQPQDPVAPRSPADQAAPEPGDPR